MKEEITNTQDVIDSRDIIKRIEELEETINDALKDEDTTDEQDELKALKALGDEASGSPDWPNGEALINEDHFTEYCEELCQDIGDIPKELPWYIANHIDWESVAREVKMDYMEVDFDGVSYLIRA